MIERVKKDEELLQSLEKGYREATSEMCSKMMEMQLKVMRMHSEVVEARNRLQQSRSQEQELRLKGAMVLDRELDALDAMEEDESPGTEESSEGLNGGLGEIDWDAVELDPSFDFASLVSSDDTLQAS